MTYVDGLFSLAGRVGLVTGASRGIGRALAVGLAEAGATVTGIGRSVAPGGAAPRGFTYRRCDVTDSRAFAVMSADVAREGGLDFYVHAAGVSLAADGAGATLEGFAATVATNLTAAFACCFAAASHMRSERGGSIITITSINALQAFPGNPGYVASKGGLHMLTKALALDLGSRNVRVNAIAPGYVRTDMTEQSYQDPTRREERLQRMIIKRWGVPDDLVGAAIFLASNASSYVTGQTIVVDGGWTAKGL